MCDAVGVLVNELVAVRVIDAVPLREAVRLQLKPEDGAAVVDCVGVEECVFEMDAVCVLDGIGSPMSLYTPNTQSVK